MTSRRVCILFVNEYFPPATLGGAEISTQVQATALAEAGHDVTVLTPNYGAAPEEIIDGVRILRFAFPIKLGVGESVRPILFQNPMFHAYLAYWTWRTARRVEAELVHAHNSFSLVGAAWGARFAGIPFAATLRDSMQICSAGAICLHERDVPPHRCSIDQYRACFSVFQKRYTPDASLFAWLKASARNWLEVIDVKARQRALRRAASMITVSDAIGNIYARAGLLSSEPCTVYNSPRARPLRNVPGDSETPTVLYVGKLSFGKGTDILLRAVPRVHEKVPKARFVLAGRLNPLIPIPEDPRIEATGPLPHESVLELYASASVVVLPAVWKEPFPRVLLEAMQAGRPVVASQTGGIPELVDDGVTGILVPPSHPDALAGAIVELLSDREKAETMGRAGKARVEHAFGIEKTLPSLLRAYDEALAK